MRMTTAARTLCLCVSVLLVACQPDGSPEEIQLEDACLDQGERWCEWYGACFETPAIGCPEWYAGECVNRDLNNVAIEAQDACLDAMSDDLSCIQRWMLPIECVLPHATGPR